MPVLIDRAKGWYQYGKAMIPAWAAAARHPYHREAAFRLAVERMRGRTFEPSAPLNFIMVVPVVNWESAFVETARRYGTCHHLDLEARGFFPSPEEWLRYRAHNAAAVEEFVRSSQRDDCLNVVLLYISEFHLDPGRLAQLRRSNFVTVNFSWDDVLHYVSRHRGQAVGVRGVANAVDVNLTMAASPMSRYARDGAPVFYWYGSPAEIVDRELPAIEYERVLFFGTRYGFRAELVDYLHDRGLPLDVFGAGWGTSFIDYASLLYRIPRYAVNLGVSTIGYTRNLCLVKGRDIEVPAAGGLYLTNHSKEILHVYEAGRDILTYRSKDDSYRQASAVLENPAAYQGVRASGARRAQAFSWDARFRFLVQLLRNITAEVA